MWNRVVIWVGLLSLCAGAAGAGDRPRPRAATTQASACGVAVGQHLLITSLAVVDGAREIRVESVEGMSRKATVVARDAASGLALLRTDGERMSFARLAEEFEGGDVQCIALARESAFQPIPESIPGATTKPAENWTVNLKSAPRLPGAPLVVDNDVVGLALAMDPEQKRDIPAATFAQLRALLVDQRLDAGRAGTPRDAIVRITSTTALPASSRSR